jgi:hypothetical protein
VLDEILLGDPSRRLAFGLALLVLTGAALLWVEWRIRRFGDAYRSHRTPRALAMSFAPVGVGIMISAVWGVLGVVVFVAVAVTVCGGGVVVMLLRRTA